MIVKGLHTWNLAPRDAISLQSKITLQVVLEDRFHGIKTIAGADASLDARSSTGFAGIIVFEFLTLREAVSGSICISH